MKDVTVQLKRHKVGTISGAVLGIAMAWYAIKSGVADLSQLATAGKGALDIIMSRTAPVELATQKLYIAFAMAGAVTGYVVDVLISKMR